MGDKAIIEIHFNLSPEPAHAHSKNKHEYDNNSNKNRKTASQLVGNIFTWYLYFQVFNFVQV